ncbi:serine/threonine protein kinase, variant [Aphanomyces invadans]|uniref:Serine/threonine protein kinase, variant n=1 Tax=Aphanomyces invadans TaxID=157072 RepID=A0A024UD89_9STRA|nr:serine/threonine protein kinase, variant [Aphanomyces invadans]ETW04361.1 serine/threonine protein kinase, variant [Aphanomyces invadans]|eukprot:XP_008867317.1 serine/threonine protein kinase, variant [Aphanomyces invadans]
MVAVPPEARHRELEAAQEALKARLRDIDPIHLQHRQAFIQNSLADATKMHNGVPPFLQNLVEEQKKDEDIYDQYIRDATLHNQRAIRFQQQMESPFASLPVLNDRFALVELLGVSTSKVEVWKAADTYDNNSLVTLKISSDHHMIAYDHKALARIDVHDTVVRVLRDGVLTTTFQDTQYSMYGLKYMDSNLETILLGCPNGRLPFLIAEAVAFQVAHCIQHLCIEVYLLGLESNVPLRCWSSMAGSSCALRHPPRQRPHHAAMECRGMQFQVVAESSGTSPDDSTPQSE